MLWYVPKTRMLPFGFTTRQTSRSHSDVEVEELIVAEAVPRLRHRHVRRERPAQPPPLAHVERRVGDAVVDAGVGPAAQRRQRVPRISVLRSGGCTASLMPPLDHIGDQRGTATSDQTRGTLSGASSSQPHRADRPDSGTHIGLADSRATQSRLRRAGSRCVDRALGRLPISISTLSLIFRLGLLSSRRSSHRLPRG